MLHTLGRLKLIRRRAGERRAAVRHPAYLPGTARYRGMSYPVRLNDLSRRGAQVVLDGCLPRISERLELSLPRSGGTLLLLGRVRHVEVRQVGGRHRAEIGLELSVARRAGP